MLASAKYIKQIQPLDVAVNKPAKEFYRQKFQEWHSRQISQQIEELDGRVMALQPVNMGLPLMKELGAKWIEEMADYIRNNPQFAVQGITHSGISLPHDGINIEEDSDEDTSDNDYEEDDDDGEDDNDDESEEVEEASSEDENSDEKETDGSLYIEDDAELSDSYQCDGNNTHKVSIVVDDEDWPEYLPNQYF